MTCLIASGEQRYVLRQLQLQILSPDLSWVTKDLRKEDVADIGLHLMHYSIY